MCPGAPFLVEGVADAVAARLAVVGRAGRQALALLPAADSVLLISAGSPGQRTGDDGWRLIPPGSTIARTSIVRSDGPVLPHQRRQATASERAGGVNNMVVDPAVGTIVGASLLADTADSEHAAPEVTTVEIHGDPAGAAAAVTSFVDAADRVAVLVIADGAACHGDDAPGRRDDRSTSYDAALAAALTIGDPDALGLACADRELASELLAIVDPLDVLARLTATKPPDASELLYVGAPTGVGYLVASWRWDRS